MKSVSCQLLFVVTSTLFNLFGCACFSFAASPVINQFKSFYADTGAGVAQGNQYGGTVALEGNRGVIGSLDYHASYGAAFFLRNNGGTWTQTKIVHENTIGGYLGSSVDLSGDTSIVGALGETAAYIYKDNGSTWTESAKLTPNDTVPFRRFAWSSQIEGDTTVIGDPGDPSRTTNSGFAYVFRDNGLGAWNQVQKLVPNDAAARQEFGDSLALDGNTLVVGAPGTKNGTGAAYLYHKDATGIWSQSAKLTASGGLANDRFGSSVAISGNTAVIGAPISKSAYIYRDDGFGNWNQLAKLSVVGTGISVAIDGDTIIVGDPGNPHYGMAYVYRETSPGSWTEFYTLDTTFDTEDLGSAAAIDGQTVLLGSILDFHGPGLDDGSAHLFQLPVPEPTTGILAYFASSIGLFMRRRI